MTGPALRDFLLARITEDQVRATLREWHTSDCSYLPDPNGYTYPCDCGVPERLMRDAEAKRRVVEEHPPTDPFNHEGDRWCRRCLSHEDDTGYPDEWVQASYPCPTLRLLAAVYSDHPDYRVEWWRP